MKPSVLTDSAFIDMQDGGLDTKPTVHLREQQAREQLLLSRIQALEAARREDALRREVDQLKAVLENERTERKLQLQNEQTERKLQDERTERKLQDERTQRKLQLQNERTERKLQDERTQHKLQEQELRAQIEKLKLKDEMKRELEAVRRQALDEQTRGGIRELQKSMAQLVMQRHHANVSAQQADGHQQSIQTLTVPQREAPQPQLQAQLQQQPELYTEQPTSKRESELPVQREEDSSVALPQSQAPASNKHAAKELMAVQQHADVPATASTKQPTPHTEVPSAKSAVEVPLPPNSATHFFIR